MRIDARQTRGPVGGAPKGERGEAPSAGGLRLTANGVPSGLAAADARPPLGPATRTRSHGRWTSGRRRASSGYEHMAKHGRNQGFVMA